MNTVAALPKLDREYLFRSTSEKDGTVSPIIVEKDFWVVWVLKQLFNLDIASKLCFRGGTSLSKVFSVINRFSEDIDLGIERTFFNFNDERDLLSKKTSSQKEKALRLLNKKTRQYLKNDLTPLLQEEFKAILGEDGSDVRYIQEERQYWINYYYPQCLLDDYKDNEYIKPFVRLEILSRTDNKPSVQREIYPRIFDYFSENLKDPKCIVTVTGIERTFWEKVTLLHKEFQQDKLTTERISRHLYDVFMISKQDDFDNILCNKDLFRSVVEQKKLFFYQPTANYGACLEGELNLVPPPTLIDEVRKDYDRMEEMIFGHYPDFQVLIGDLKTLESQINKMAEK